MRPAANFPHSVLRVMRIELAFYGSIALFMVGLLLVIAWNDGPASERSERLYALLDGVFEAIAEPAMEFDRKGNIFRGTHADFRREGYGELLTADGFQYRGNFERGSISGAGEALFPDGSIYRGQWYEGKFHGPGMHLSHAGWRYTGEFSGGKRQVQA